MSHFTKIKTSLRDKAALVTALQALLGVESVEVHDEVVELNGYAGAKKKAEVIVRKAAMGELYYADMGFKQQEDGTFSWVLDDLDKSRLGSWNDRLMVEYTKACAVQELTVMGCIVSERRDENGQLVIIGQQFTT